MDFGVSIKPLRLRCRSCDLLLSDIYIRITRYLRVVTTTIDIAANIDTDDGILPVVGCALYGFASCYHIVVSALGIALCRKVVTCLERLDQIDILAYRSTDIDLSIALDRSSVTATEDIVDGSNLTFGMIWQYYVMTIDSNGLTLETCFVIVVTRSGISVRITDGFADIDRRTCHHQCLCTIAAAIDGTDTGERTDIQLRIIIRLIFCVCLF